MPDTSHLHPSLRVYFRYLVCAHKGIPHGSILSCYDKQPPLSTHTGTLNCISQSAAKQHLRVKTLLFTRQSPLINTCTFTSLESQSRVSTALLTLRFTECIFHFHFHTHLMNQTLMLFDWSVYSGVQCNILAV